MIEKISGKVVGSSGRVVHIEVSGIAFGVQCARPEIHAQGSFVSLQTTLIWNQEKGPLLYGFADDLEKQLFSMLISCPKIGPSIALQALSQMTPYECISAIGRGDAKALSSLHGIGAKKAAQIITDLQEQCAALRVVSSATGDTGAAGHNVRIEVAQALESLGYTRPEINQAFSSLGQDDSLSFDQLLRSCLKNLSLNK
ncbi:Holliday junction branch migration protein RuvA [Candidatus Dependentiae bacterium]|nr:Holliday junction branch migration protein RuvA [Candidatus Dependentiae bacterium]